MCIVVDLDLAVHVDVHLVVDLDLVVSSRDYETMGTMKKSTNAYVRVVLKKWTMRETMTE